ncbi:MAG: DNA-3-methyladenine glycosylase I [Myxococcales bacterium]|nr:DNA-3-methyladenine glycosylase I [Myxococcales bacterium]
MMMSYDEIWGRAAARHGTEALTARLPAVKTDAELRALGDDRILATMARVVFSAGFRWSVINAKWPGFEEAFMSFAPDVVASFAPEERAALASDTRIVRNPQKITATIANAHLVVETSAEHGGFGAFLADWPANDVVGLWQWLKKRGSRLGGDSGPRILRGVGKDTFILTGDVTRALTDMGVLTAKPTSQKQQRLAQDAFLQWQADSGRPLSHLSVIVACGTDS